MGWPTGLEPATARTTIWGSTIELRPPIANTLDFRAPHVKFGREKSVTTPQERGCGEDQPQQQNFPNWDRFAEVQLLRLAFSAAALRSYLFACL
jgi:hypothetical protein